MAMLAEPRRFRKKFNLNPRGKPLFEDENRLGTKMLKIMGWSKGKGLGAREDGSQEFVRVRYKHDSNGIGYEDRDDQWTEHEKQFNGLLSSLHNSEANSEAEDEEKTERVGFGFVRAETVKDNKNVKDKISGESLEEKSKNSKTRVHYKKFTKGKDLSQYSEKDLANIFGKKTQETSNFQIFEPMVKNIEKEESIVDGSKGITYINSGTSVNDYFKQKMDEIKRKRMHGILRNVDSTETFVEQCTIVEDPKNKKKYNEKFENSELIVEVTKICKKKRKNSEIINQPSQNSEENEEMPTEKSKKKKRKLDISDKEKLPLGNLQNIFSEELEENPTGKSKKKKRKLEISENEKLPSVNLQNHISEALEQNPTEKSKKKKRKLEISENEKLPLVNLQNHISEALEENPTENSKKNKRKLEISDNEKLPLENLQKPITEELKEIVKEKSKKKKVKLVDNEELQESFLQNSDTEILKNISKEKKKKKNRNLEITTNNDELANKQEIEISINKKKKIKNSNLDQNMDSTEKIEFIKPKNKKQKKNAIKLLSTDLKICEDPKDSKFKSKTDDESPGKSVSEKTTNSVFKISQYCAEKFRHTNLNGFTGSNLTEVVGYGLDEQDLKLEIVSSQHDMEHITKLWSTLSDTSLTNKYELYQKHPLKEYFKKAKKAKANKKKTPKLNMKRFKNKSIFRTI